MSKKTSDNKLKATENQVVNETAEMVDNTSADNTSGAPEGESPDVVIEKPVVDEKPKKMTEDEVNFLADALKIDIGVRVKVVPFNTIEWKDGTIVGVIGDKRSMKVLYAIKLDDGRRIVKTHDSDLLQKSDEKVEIVRAKRGSTVKKLTDEEFAEAEAKAAEKVGTSIMYIPYKSDEKVEGKITSIVPDNRSGRILYKIEGLVNGEHKISHKNADSSDIEYLDTVDEELKEAFMKRREVRLAKLALTPEEKIVAAEEKIQKMVERQEELLKQIEAEREALQKMKAEYEAEANSVQIAENTSTEESEDLS